MLEAFSQGSEDSILASSEPGCESSGNAKTTPTVEQSSENIGPMFPASRMCPCCAPDEPCAICLGAISSAAAFQPSPSASSAGGEEPQTIAGSGPSFCESFAYYDPDMCSWKTFQV